LSGRLRKLVDELDAVRLRLEAIPLDSQSVRDIL
jgi:hypothetical protein